MQICGGQMTNVITVGGRVDDVAWFAYLGSILTCNGDVIKVSKVALVFQHRDQYRPLSVISVISR